MAMLRLGQLPFWIFGGSHFRRCKRRPFFSQGHGSYHNSSSVSVVRPHGLDWVSAMAPAKGKGKSKGKQSVPKKAAKFVKRPAVALSSSSDEEDGADQQVF